MRSQPVDFAREESRNRVLRRADWRFLLSDPYPAQSVCLTDGLLAQAVSAISERMVTAPQAAASRAGAEQCDLVAAFNPDRAILQQAWLSLRPGGQCYTEWYSPLAGRVRHITQRLQAAGFEDMHGYWPWPWPQRAPAFWLPLDAPGLVTYFLQERARYGGSLRRSVFQLRKAIWRMGERSGMLRPLCMIARKPGAADPANDLRAQWSASGLGPTPNRLHSLLLTGGQHSLNKVVALVSPAPQAAPQLIVKWPRVPEASAGLRHEAAVLQRVQQRRPPLPGVPRLVFCGETRSAFSLGETVLNGAPLYTRLQRATFRALAQQATTWLIELAGTPCPRRSAAHSIEELCAELRDVCGADLNEALWPPTLALLTDLKELPVVCEQRDFSPWNVLIDDHDQWNVLDWEAAEVDGLPARDLIYFLTYLSYFVEGVMQSGQYRAAYRRLLDSTSFTGAVFAECQARYTEQVGLEARSLKALRLLTWMLHARSECERSNAGQASRSARSKMPVEGRSLFISLWEEELTEQSDERPG